MVRPLLALTSALCMSAAGFEAQNAPAATRAHTVYVSVHEDTGAPVLDLTPADFVIKEDGKTRDVLKVELARTPLQLMILVDDNGTGFFRAGLIQFVQQLQGRAEMAVSSVVGQTQQLVDYTTNIETVANAITTLSARPGTPDGGQLLEGIFQASREQQRRESARPVIVALTVGGEEHSTVPAHHVLDQLAKSRSKLYVIQVVANTTLRSTVQVTKPAALLGEGPKQTGGWRQEIVAATGIVQGLSRLAAELKNQYAVEYSRPPKGKSIEKLNVSVTRRGLNLRAPTKVPGR
jgi:VWFA-related protein